MPELNLFLKLRERAEKIFKSRPLKQQTISYDKIYDLINDLSLKQIEVELISEDFQNVSLELEESRHRYTDLYNFIPFGYFTFNAKGQIIEINEAGANLLGFKKSQVTDRNLLRYIAPNFQHIFTEHCQNVLETNKPAICELKLLRKNGPLFYAQFHSKACFNFVSGEKHIITFVNDITNLKQKEEYLFQQNQITALERDAVWNELALVITHELNHPLSVINNYLNGSIRRLENDTPNIPEIIKALKQASEQSHRISDIVLRMKNFSCNGNLHFESLLLDDVIQEALRFVNFENENTLAEIQYSAPKNLPSVVIDKIHIQQVIVNICRNGIEAARDAGIHPPKLRIEANQVSITAIEVCIMDNGPGIQAESLHQLFNPYFTTKNYGIGIGLAVSRSIIKAHQGELSVEENPLGGSCFKFTLPIHIAKADSNFRVKRLRSA